MTTLGLLIPAYNAAHYLPRLLESARRQTIPFDEIWVYDDCSSDNTADVAARWGARVVRGAVNVGCSAGKNILARRAGTEWIHFHDADDELTPFFVERAVPWTYEAVDIVLFSYEERDQKTGELIGVRVFDHEPLNKDAKKYSIQEQINPFCGVYRRNSILAAGGYDEDPDVLYNEDVASHIRMAFAGLRFAADPSVTVINHRRAGSMSSSNGYRCALAHLKVMQKTLAREGSEAYRVDIGRQLWSLSGILGAYGDWDRADETVLLALQLSPPYAGSAVFRLLAKWFPRLALRAREVSVRMTRPHLRHGLVRPPEIS